MSGTDASVSIGPRVRGGICPNCGRWIEPREYHVCGVSVGGEWTWRMALDYPRIAIALERIADALEKLAR